MQNVTWEYQTLLLFVFFGMCSGLGYDLLRILRNLFKGIRSFASIQDLLFWIFIGVWFSYLVFLYNDGRIRGFLIAGFAIGMILENLTISRVVVPLFIKILEIPVNALRNITISIKLKSIKLVVGRIQDGSEKRRISKKKKNAEDPRGKCT